MSESGALDLFLSLAAVLVLIDRIVNIVANLRAAKTDTMPRGAIREELQRLEKKIDDVHNERRESSKELHEKVEALGKSISTAWNDLSRVIGRLEGSHEAAETIKRAVGAIITTTHQ